MYFVLMLTGYAICMPVLKKENLCWSRVTDSRQRGGEEMKPSIDVVTKIADLLEVSLDYLVGKTDVELDDAMLKRIQLVSKLPDKEKEHLFVFLDSFIDRMKLQGIL